MGNPKNVMAFCDRNYMIKDHKGILQVEVDGNYQTINTHSIEGLKTKSLTIDVEHPSKNVSASIFVIVCS